MTAEGTAQPARRRWRPIHALQAAGAYAAFAVARAMPLDAASALGGRLGRAIGPRLGVTDRARRNLRSAFPDSSPEEIEAIVGDMWDNLGRMALEFPHLDKLRFDGPDAHVEVVGAEYIDALRDDGRPGVFFSAHMANWEIGPLSAARRGLPVDMVYRAPNNPLMARLLNRRHPGQGELIPKGAPGARQMLARLKKGGHLAMLVDQKMNDGIAVPFFGRDAMTAPALAQLALKFDLPAIPSRIERLGGVRFRITFYPPLELPRTGDRRADVAAIMAEVNRHIESWVRERPAQWLWLHNRWPD